MHIELLGWSATQPNTGSAAAALTGDSLTVKNSRKGARILTAWADQQVAGWQQIIRPSGHDTTRDFRARVTASEVELLLPIGMTLEVQPQETLGITIAGSNTAGDVELGHALMQYDDLPGADQRLITWAQLNSRMESLLTIEASLTVTAGPAYTGEELLTAESDLLKANRDYAWLGARVGVEAGAVYLRGPDTSNLRIGMPGNDLDGDLTTGFFCTLARAFGQPLIPVINSGNKASTYIGGSSDENATAVPLSLILALLK